MDTVQVQVVDTVQVVTNYMQSGYMDIIITIATVIIACAAVFIPFYQIHTTRKHNKLSVKPKLGITTCILPNNVGISIKNTGIGPAIIEKISLCVNGKEMIPLLLRREYGEIIKELGFDFKYLIHSKGEYIEPGYSFYIMELQGIKTSSKDVYKKVVEALKSINIDIKYLSIYDEEFNVEYAPEEH